MNGLNKKVNWFRFLAERGTSEVPPLLFVLKNQSAFTSADAAADSFLP